MIRKSGPGFPLREALATSILWLEASAGVGRSDKIMLKRKKSGPRVIQSQRIQV